MKYKKIMPIFVCFCLLISQVVASNVSNEIDPNTEDQGIEILDEGYNYNELEESLEEFGKARAIIQFDVENYLPEGNIQDEDLIEFQRSEIDRVQNEILVDLEENRNIQENNDEIDRNILKMKYTPFLVLNIDKVDFGILQQNKNVVELFKDEVYYPGLADSTEQIGANYVQNDLGYTGIGQTIAILDSGVDKYHPFLSGRVVEEACFSFIGDIDGREYTSACRNRDVIDLGPDAGLHCLGLSSKCDHGTHVAGIAAGKGETFNGIAPDASIIAISPTAYPEGSGNYPNHPLSNQMQALEFVYEHTSEYNIASVNMSLGRIL